MKCDFLLDQALFKQGVLYGLPQDLEIKGYSSLSPKVVDAGRKRGGGMFQIALGFFL